MNAGIEAVGDAATGALIGRAVEPGHGEHHGGGHDGAGHGACLNCGTALVGAYCHACGQNGHLHRTIGGFAHDLLHGVFHFEGKIWATLPMLLFKPGALTRRYIRGERARFVSPLAMFLFCVFLMFAIVGGLAGSLHAPEVREADKKRSLAEIESAIAKNDQMRTDLRARIRAEGRADRDTTILEARLDAIEDDTDALHLARDFVGGGRTNGPALGFKTGWAKLDKGIQAANANPNLFLYRLQTSAYKYSWLLIPISTPLVWLLFFWKRQYKFYDHLVFVTFSLTFMLLLVTVLTIGGVLGAPEGLIASAALLIPPLHSYKQLRGAYESRRLPALLRTVLLMAFGMVALTIYLMILLLLGIMK